MTAGQLAEIRNRDRFGTATEGPQDRSALLDEVDRLRKALGELVDAVEKTDAASNGIFVMAAVHGMNYEGPNHGPQIEVARAVLGAA